MEAATTSPASGHAMPGKMTARRRKVEPQTLVILGNGMAGCKLCERLVEAGHQRYRIVVFGEEPRPAYDRVHITEFLTGKPAQQLELKSKEWYAGHEIDLHLGDPAVSIDREKRLVRSANGFQVQYDKLVFATGSKAYVPPLPGSDLPGVFVYRTMEDLVAIREWSANCERAAVLGGGLLGLEAAWALLELKVKPWVVERGSGLLARQLNPQASTLLLKHTEKLGMNVCLGRETKAIEPHGDDLLLQLNTGEALQVQMVIIATGIRPRDELAAACGLKLGPRGGILVNDQLETSDPNIYAVGECAVHNGVIYGLVAPGYRMVDSLVAVLAGKRKRFTGADLSARLKLPGIEVSTMGDFQADAATIVHEDKTHYRRLVIDRGRVVGAVGVGEWPELPRVQELVDRRGRLWSWKTQRFERTGRIWNEEAVRNVAQWPADALVCNCLGVRRGQLSAACAGGCKTVEALAEKTKASTVCGSCKPLLADLVGQAMLFPALKGAGLLMFASACALLLALAISLLKPITIPDTVQIVSVTKKLWLDSFARQVTGFTLLGISVISLIFSLRKRIKKFTLGNYGWWRAAHGILGLLTLVALVTHTGFRMGQNLNCVLMFNFLALALVGAMAGGVTALENRLSGPAARRLRAFWTGTHIALTWPLPVLITFHIIAAYYF